MSSWRSGEDGPPPKDFMTALMGKYEVDEAPHYHLKEEVDEYSENEVPQDYPAWTHSQQDAMRPVVEGDHHSPSARQTSSRSRSRSPLGRWESDDDTPSPVVYSALSVVATEYLVNDNGNSFEEQETVELGRMEHQHPEQEEFYDPDAYDLYERPVTNRMSLGHEGDQNERERMNEGDGDERDRPSVRGRARGGRRGRGRAPRVRGTGRSRRVGADQNASWQVGHPIHEIWVHDEDVPSEFKEMVRDIVMRREARAAEMRERFLRRGRQEGDGRRTHEHEGHESGNEEEEFLDAIDGRGNPLLLEGEAARFEWSAMDTFQAVDEVFKVERTGSVCLYASAYDAFRSYWDDTILQMLVDETNLYASKISSAAFQKDWSPTNSHEILCLFAFWMMLGIIRMPTINSCFSVDPLLKTEVFRRIFTQRRYYMLTRALNFVDTDPVTAYPTTGDAAASSDLLHCLRPIIDHLNAKFQANYIPSQNICLNESLNISQYIRSKGAKFGIKSFELCESATGYLWSFIVYTGKQANLDLPHNPLVLKSTAAAILKLISPLLNKGYRLFMDSGYNSPLLARYLKRNGTDCVGTLRPNCTDVPDIIIRAPLKQGQLIARHSGNVSVLSWQDKKRITMISTCHGSGTAWSTVPSKNSLLPLPFEPQVVLDYNKWMVGVDQKHQMLEPYLNERQPCNKWYMKLFKRLLNCSILNSRILLQSSTQKYHHHLSFRLQLVDFILTNHLSHLPCPRSVSRPAPYCTLNQTHWLIRNPQRESDIRTNRQARAQCVVCYREGRKRSKTPYRCEICNVPLCVEYCFKVYHS